MIIAVAVSLEEIVEMGRDYPWPRPVACCTYGGKRLWVHGYVEAYFDGMDEPVWLKLFRCPDCKGVHKLRPAGYFKGFRADIETIRRSIVTRVKTGRWPSDISRTRAGHWLRSLKRKAVAYLGLEWLGTKLIEAFDRLMFKGKIPSSSSFKAVFRPSGSYSTEDCQ